jgi:hypothetical protein
LENAAPRDLHSPTQGHPFGVELQAVKVSKSAQREITTALKKRIGRSSLDLVARNTSDDSAP